jgi:hypothetical protein
LVQISQGGSGWPLVGIRDLSSPEGCALTLGLLAVGCIFGWIKNPRLVIRSDRLEWLSYSNKVDGCLPFNNIDSITVNSTPSHVWLKVHDPKREDTWYFGGATGNSKTRRPSKYFCQGNDCFVVLERFYPTAEVVEELKNRLPHKTKAGRAL